MARYLFPATDSDRTAYVRSGNDLIAASSGTAVAGYLNAAGTSPTSDVLQEDLSAFTVGEPWAVDSLSRYPRWWGPDGVTRMWISIGGGTLVEVVADVHNRFTAVEARVAAVEPGGGSAALRVSQNLADLASASTARTNLGLGTAATTAAAAYDPAGSAAAAQAASQPLDAGLTAIAGLTPAGSAVVQESGGVWAARTPTQLAATLPADQVAGTASLRTLGTGATQAAGGRAALAQRVLASATRPYDASQVHPSPPTIAVSAGNASPSIASAVLVPQARASSTLIDVANDPHFEYVGMPTGKLDVSSGNKSYPALLQGGSSQSARHRVRFRFHFTGTEFEASFRQRTTSFTYRIWVDGLPLAADFAATAVTISQTYLLKVTFGAVGSRVVELEVVDPEFGGVWVEPTGSVTRTRLARPVLMGFGDSITGGANGVSAWNTWLRYCAQILGCDWVNTAIGGTGYLTGAGTSADFRQRITPDIASQAPDVLVLFGSYNDSGTYTQGQIQTEAEYVLGQLASQCPDTIVITVGCWQINDNAQAAFVAADNGVKAAAATAGVPFVSLCDPLLATGTAPAWAATTAYAVGDKVVANGWVQVCRTAHTSGASFAKTNWRASTFVNGTGRSGATVGDGNADVIVGTDGVHPTADGHRTIGYHLAQEITRHLRALATA